LSDDNNVFISVGVGILAKYVTIYRLRIESINLSLLSKTRLAANNEK
jgi:hypothetical protein